MGSRPSETQFIIFTSDESFRSRIVASLTSLMADPKRVSVHADIRSVKYSAGRRFLVIADWQGSQPNIFAVLNHFRSSVDKFDIPIIIPGQSFTIRDTQQIHEFPFVEHMESGAAIASLQRIIPKLESDRDSFTKQAQSCIQQLEKSRRKNLPLAHECIAMIATSEFQGPLAIVACRWLEERNLIEDAYTIASVTSEQMPASLLIKTELAYLHLRRNSPSAALKILLDAQRVSRSNIRRECMMATFSLYNKEPERAENFFRKATSIDSGHEEAIAGIELAVSYQKYLSLHGSDDETSFSSFLNRRGVTLVKGGRLEDGLLHYQTALNFVFDPSSRSKLLFNLGLGYLRGEMYLESYYWFCQAQEVSGGKLPKVNAYVDRLRSEFLIDPFKINREAPTELDLDSSGAAADQLYVISEKN